MGFFGKLLGIVMVFGVINLALWGCQELYYREDTKQIKEIETWLQTEQTNIKNLEVKIVSEKSELDSKQRQLNQYIGSGYTVGYISSISDYNRLVDIFKTDVNTYNKNSMFYNSKIDEVNALIKKSGTRWYLIPIPLSSKTVKSKLPIK